MLHFPKKHRPPLWRAARYMGVLGCALFGCAGIPEVNLEPRPESIVSSGDYRLITLNLNPAGTGFDLDDDQKPDNHFPLLLDQLYFSLEDAVVETLESELEEYDAQQIWSALSEILLVSGLPIGTDAYNHSLDTSIRSASLNFLLSVSASEDLVTARFFSGLVLTDGYSRDDEIGAFDGYGVPTSISDPSVSLSNGDLVLLYPDDWFSLPMVEGLTVLDWTGEGLYNGMVGGKISLEAIVDAVASQIPATIQLGDQVIPIPVGSIEATLTESLLEFETSDGTLMFDQTLADDGSAAISAALIYEANPAQIISTH